MKVTRIVRRVAVTYSHEFNALKVEAEAEAFLEEGEDRRAASRQLALEALADIDTTIADRTSTNAWAWHVVTGGDRRVTVHPPVVVEQPA